MELCRAMQKQFGRRRVGITIRKSVVEEEVVVVVIVVVVVLVVIVRVK